MAKQDFEWHKEVHKCSKLEFYRYFKDIPKLEDYLTNITPRKHRTSFTKLLISAHRLKIETDRYNNTENRKQRTEGTCDFCHEIGKLCVDDEIHFLFTCKNNMHLRDEFFTKIRFDDNKFKDTLYSSKIGIIKEIMKNPIYTIELNYLAEFIHKSENCRKNIKND